MRITHALKLSAAVGTGALMVVAGVPAYAGGGHAGKAPIRTVTTGLDGPFGLDVVSPHAALVAESESGEVTAVNLRSGARTTLISKIPGAAGVTASRGKIFVVLGGPNPEGPPPPPSKYPPASVLMADRNGKHVRVVADLLKYELKHNPDGQKQFDKAGKPYDALSNPFSMTATRWGLLVADGGANDVLRVDPWTGKVSTYFVPPNPRTKECLAKGAQANPGTVGCDSVPTGIAVRGPYVYVSTLGAEKPGASVIYQLDGRTGKVLRKYGGFTSLTGVAVSPHGTIYASEVLFGAPASNPPPGFDPSKVGRLTRIRHGQATHAAVTMPTGIEYANGKLYSTSWSIAGLFGVKHAGRLVEVDERAFR
ncbi:ScyD/ScyE family protein [Actinoplanes sp. LDG1-06]|uniref:ScyD/ScyE family protein n=1 Tax=Paractinoplanes ovalisporus TaxID=2810368 RepID=A0ABS2AF49_9ACTN|nr:ScyD/ScyE family protein [Actinoplanes ovalisporus]MBM2618453.1 ScyD/ScyE family protein [Actinoplanes ovalisporus]